MSQQRNKSTSTSTAKPTLIQTTLDMHHLFTISKYNATQAPILPSHSTDAFQSHTSSNDVLANYDQQPHLHGLDVDHSNYITGSSRDNKILIKIDSNMISQLSSDDLSLLLSDSVHFLQTTPIPLLQLFKRKQSVKLHEVESFYTATPLNGYCFLHSIHQLHSQSNIQVKNMSLHQYCSTMQSFMQPMNPDVTRINYMQQQLHHHVPSISSEHWMSTENLHLYKFPFMFNLWHLHTDEQYLNLIFSNLIPSVNTTTSSPELTYSQAMTIAMHSCNLHYSSNHFYAVPMAHQVSHQDTKEQVCDALCDVAMKIALLFRSTSTSDALLAPQHTSSSSNIILSTHTLISVESVEDPHDHNERRAAVMPADSDLLMDFICEANTLELQPLSRCSSTSATVMPVDANESLMSESDSTSADAVYPRSLHQAHLPSYEVLQPPARGSSTSATVMPVDVTEALMNESDSMIASADVVDPRSLQYQAHLPSYDLASLATIINSDKFFRQASSRSVLNNQLDIGMVREPALYPSSVLRNKLSYLLKRTEVKQSLLKDSGNGLFATTNMAKGELIQTYGGTTQPCNPYSMQVKVNTQLIIGGPPNEDPWTKAGAINDYIWDSKLINCKRDAAGNIFTLRSIRKGEELYMSYGMQYNWEPVKRHYCSTFCATLLHMMDYLPTTIVTPSAEDVTLTFMNLMSSEHEGLLRLLHDFFNHDKGPSGTMQWDRTNDEDVVMFPLHNEAPELLPGMSTGEWIELLCRTSWFYRHCCFRCYDNPKQIIKAPVLTVSSKGSRFSTRLSAQPSKSFIGMDASTTTSTHVMNHPAKSVPSCYNMGTLQQSHSDSNLDAQCPNCSNVEPDSTEITTTNIDCSFKSHLPSQADSSTTIMTEPSQRTATPQSLTAYTNTAADRLNNLADNICPVKVRRMTTQHGLIILYVNIGSNMDTRRKEIFDLSLKHNADITCVSDCKVTTTNQATYKFHAKKHLPAGFTILVCPTKTDQTSNRSVGGTLILVGPRLHQVKMMELVPLGCLQQLHVQFGKVEIILYPIYFPRHNNEPGSFASRIASEMQCSYERVHDTIHTILSTSLQQHFTATSNIIIVGDFNINIATNLMSEFAYLQTKHHFHHAANEAELGQTSYSMPRKTMTSESRIDFLLYRGPQLRSLSSTCLHHEHYLHDHTPLLTQFHIDGQAIHGHHPMYSPSMIKYDWSNKPERAAYERSTMSMDAHENKSGSERLQAITEDAVNIAKQLRPSKGASRQKHCNDLCPVNSALKLARKNVILINRHLHGYKKYSKWSDSNYQHSINNICKQWRRDLKHLSSNKQIGIEVSNATTYGPTFWKYLTLEEIRAWTPVAIVAIHKLSTSKLKRQRKEEYTNFLLKRQFLYQIQKIGLPIKTILKPVTLNFDLSCIKDTDGQWISEPGRITEQLKSNFNTWFNNYQDDDINDDTWLYDHMAYMTETRSKNIPDDIAQQIWTAMQSPSLDNKVVDSFKKSVMVTPTFEEYMVEVSTGSPHSAGGMSGLTYGMLKSLPHHIHQAIYDALVDTWNNDTVPESWKWRWLHPIPKVNEPMLSQLRPLCLLEILRKLWTSLFTQRIAKFMYTEQVLHRSQHAGKGKGTESGVLEFATVLETAKENKTQLYISSYDLTKAYDTVLWKFLKFAWKRAHVPNRLAQYMVEMDEGGYMVVKSPLAIEVFNKFGYDGLLEHEIAFQPKHGTAQGGVDSSLVFTAFLDILVTAINNAGSDFYISDIDGELQLAESIGYIDDLICVQGTALGLQNIAAIVSAFCILFHMTLNVLKFRAFAINWGNPHDELAEMMTIYKQGWQPVQIPLAHDGTMTHLGVTWDMSIHNVDMFQKMTQDIEAALQNVISSKAPLEMKLTAINVTIFPKALYQAKFAPWTLEQYQRIDKLFNQAYKKVAQQRREFPNALLYMSKNNLGKEYKKFSDEVQIAKLHMWQRSVYGSNSRRAFIANSLSARVLRQAGCIPARYGPYKYSSIDNIPVGLRTAWWFSSLAEHLHLHGIVLQRKCLSLSPIPLHFEHQQRMELKHITCGITSNQEQEAYPTDATKNAEDNEVCLRKGQLWLIHNTHTNETKLIELVGFVGTETYYLPWNLQEPYSNATSTFPSVILPNSNTIMCGSGSRDHEATETLFNGPHNTYCLATLAPEKYKLTGNYSKITSIIHKLPKIVERNKQQDCHQWFQSVTSEITIHVTHKEHLQTLTEMMSKPVTSSCEIIMMKRDENNIPHAFIIRTNVINDLEPTSRHIFGLYVAAKFTNSAKQTFLQTSKIGINIHRKATNKPISHPMVALLVPKKAARMFTLPDLTMEQKPIMKQILKNCSTSPQIPNKHNDDYLQQRIFLERGLRLADDQFSTLYPQSTRCYIDESRVLEPIMHNDNGVLILEDSDTPFLQDYANHIKGIIYNKYITKRDVYRAQVFARHNEANPDPTYWTKSSSISSGKIFSKIPKGVSRALVTRLVWDWNNTGINWCKCADSIEEATCILCESGVESQKHIIWECKHRAMQEVRRHHIHHIENHVKTQHLTSSGHIYRKMHEVLSLPRNFELILGRIHAHHNDTIVTLSQECGKKLPKLIYKVYITLARMYSVMTLALYQTRERLLRHVTKAESLTKQRVLTQEMMTGLAPHHLIQPNGTKLTKQDDDIPNLAATYTQNNTTETIVPNHMKEVSEFTSNVLRDEWKLVLKHHNKKLRKEGKQLFAMISHEEQELWSNQYTHETCIHEATPPSQQQSNAVIPTTSSSNSDLNTMHPQEYYGSRWSNNSCAIDAVSFAIASIYYQSADEDKHEYTATMNNLLITWLQDTDKQCLSEACWHKHTTGVRHHIYTCQEDADFQPGKMLPIDKVIQRFFAKPRNKMNRVAIEWGYSMTCACTYYNTSTRSKTLTEVPINTHQNMRIENLVTEKIIEITNRRNRKCKRCGLLSNTIHCPAKILLVTIATPITTINTSIIEEQITIMNMNYQLKSITYYNGHHFIQQSIINNQLVTYDGMVHNGKASCQLHKQNTLTYTKMNMNIRWNMHSLWYVATDNQTHAEIVQESPPYNNNVHIAYDDMSNHNHNVPHAIIDTTHNNNLTAHTVHTDHTHGQASTLHNSVNNATTNTNNHTHVHNNITLTHTITNNTLLDITHESSPPPIVIQKINQSEDKARMLITANSKILNNNNKRLRLLSSSDTVQESNNKKTKGQCSPGTSEGRTGQG